MLTSQTGGTGFITKENGFGLSEKRPRKDERYISQRGASIGDSFAQRSFQECPEAPFRKRVHVCEGEADTLQERSHHSRQKLVEGEASSGMRSSAEFNEGKFSDSEEFGNAPPEVDPEIVLTGVNFQGEKNEGVSLNAGESEAFAGLDQRTLDMDINDLGVPVVRMEEIPFSEPEITNMDVDPGNRNDEAPEAVRGLSAEDDVGGTLTSRRDGLVADSKTDDSEGVQIFKKSDKEADLPNSSTGVESAQVATRAAPSSPGSDERSCRGIQRDHLQEQRGVEVIEVEDSDDDLDMGMNVHESDESSTKGKRPIARRVDVRRPGGYRLSTSRSTSGSYSPEDSDSDDCKVVGYHPPREDPVLVEEDDDESDSSSDDDSDSDTEVLGAASQGAIRRMWEEAAMRRRMGRAMQSEGSNANGQKEVAIDLDGPAEGTESHDLEESVATSTYRGSPDSKDQAETSEARGGFDGFGRQNDLRPGTASSAHVENSQFATPFPRDTVTNPDLDRRDEPEIPTATADFGVAAVSSFPGSDADENPPPDLANGGLHVDSDGIEDGNLDTRSNSADWDSSPVVGPGGNERLHFASGEGEGGNVGSELREGSAVADEGPSSSPDEVDLLAAKDKLKQTIHYKKSDAAEWDSRQREIQRQAAETRKLRQRRRQEADRKREMERKQKERIEELRLSQMKEERNMDIREQLRGQVRERLEQTASNCHDYATLLRQLGVVVDGGRFPTVQQVNVAYKKALMKFHPDRAMSSSKGDPRQQVEAEEKFKLILRLKDILAPVPVANDFMNVSSYRFG